MRKKWLRDLAPVVSIGLRLSSRSGLFVDLSPSLVSVSSKVFEQTLFQESFPRTKNGIVRMKSIQFRKMFNAINIKLDDLYLSYAINFMTPDDRKPTSQEIKRYSSFLKEHITIIDPKIIVLMGSTAMESLTGLNRGISKERGKWNEIILENNTLSYIITFSPSYLIRFPEYKKYSWEDLKMIRQKIHDLNLKIK